MGLLLPKISTGVSLGVFLALFVATVLYYQGQTQCINILQIVYNNGIDVARNEVAISSAIFVISVSCCVIAVQRAYVRALNGPIKSLFIIGYLC